MASATETAVLQAMRNALAQGWSDEALMVDTGALVLIRGGMAEGDALVVAQRVYDAHYKIMGAC